MYRDPDNPLLFGSAILPGVGIHDWLDDTEALDLIRENFVVDAWLANWDVIGDGLDNVILGDEWDIPSRIDAGGALGFRARGGAKGAMFGPEVGELRTMRGDGPIRTTSTDVFADTTLDQALSGARAVERVDPDTIRYEAEQLGVDPDIVDTLIARRQYIIDRFTTIPLSRFGGPTRDDHPDPDLIDSFRAVGARRFAETNDMVARPDMIVDQGDSPLGYYRAGNVRRVAVVDPTVTHGPTRRTLRQPRDVTGDRYNAVDYFAPIVEVGKGDNGRPLKNPRPVENPFAAQPGTVAFADYTVNPDGSVYINYIRTHPDHTGQGYANALIDRIVADHHGETIDFGKVMTPSMWRSKLRLESEGVRTEGRPDFGVDEVRRVEADWAAERADINDMAHRPDDLSFDPPEPPETPDNAPDTVAELLGPVYTYDDIQRLLRRGGLPQAQRDELRRLRDSMRPPRAVGINPGPAL